MKDKFFDDLREKVDNLEKFCHRDDIQIHHVLVDARERCKREIDKPY